MLRTKLRRRPRRTKPMTKYPSRRLVTVASPGDVASEDYRVLRANLLALGDKSPKTLMVTSPGPAEGKSTTCANLGVVLAQAKKSTLILDCDLREPMIHKIFSLRNTWGVVNVLVDEYDLQEIWQAPLPGLKVGVTGPVPPDPTDLLISEGFVELLNQVRRKFDYVLLDVPSTQLASDAVVVASQADGVLLVIDSEGTQKSSIRRSMRSLETVGASVLGIVINKATTSADGY